MNTEEEAEQLRDGMLRAFREAVEERGKHPPRVSFWVVVPRDEWKRETNGEMDESTASWVLSNVFVPPASSEVQVQILRDVITRLNGVGFLAVWPNPMGPLRAGSDVIVVFDHVKLGCQQWLANVVESGQTLSLGDWQHVGIPDHEFATVIPNSAYGRTHQPIEA